MAVLILAIAHGCTRSAQRISEDGFTHDSRFSNSLILDGIDVSYAQGSVDWKAVKKAGVDFVFIRAGFTAGGTGKKYTDESIYEKYGSLVLLKGGHGILDANDFLYGDGISRWFKGERINNPNTHGTGCTLSSAIASFLAKGKGYEEAVLLAKEYLTGAIGANLNLGKGQGPLNHMYAL